ncbi:hypothetical protein MKEN_00049100 [Mycena kentingensis (nom. inval.)]|nr:hypothetical protein MKEN_00049100 [Mycena kentingensis (nom. inval.)]
MSIPSPSPRLRTTASDIPVVVVRTRSAEADESLPSSPTFLSEPESPARKRSSRIPFFGRQRKKSTTSDASPVPFTRQSDAEARQSSASRLTEPRPDVPTIGSDSERSEQTTPIPPSRLPAPSLSSKLAARFAPSRQKLLNISPRKRALSTNYDTPSPSSSALALPIPQSRGPSVDSTSSDARSVTPRPTQPTITVSVPPDSLEDYKDMFTLPKPPEDGQVTPTSDSVRFPTPSTLRDSPEPSSTIKRRISRSTTDTRRISRKPVSNSTFRQDVDSTDAEDSEAVMSDSPKPSPPMHRGLTPTAEKRRTLASALPYTYSEKSTPKSIMKSPLDRPPAFPPPPPPSHPPSSALPGIPLTGHRKSDSGSSARRRAHTLSSVQSSPTASTFSSNATLPARRSSIKSPSETSPSNKKLPEVPSAAKENFDIEAASAEELRRELRVRTEQLDELRGALTLRNQQFDELASYLLKITESHVAEKKTLQKKIGTLEGEATRRDKEMQGLKWLVTNNTRGLGNLGASASKSTSALDLTAEDSGTESLPTTSGAEDSYRESGTSGGESSSVPIRKVKRNNTLMSNFYRSTRQPEATSAPPSPLQSYLALKRGALAVI